MRSGKNVSTNVSTKPRWTHEIRRGGHTQEINGCILCGLHRQRQALEGISFEMQPFTIHDLRRTGATHLHEQGFPSDVVEKALNHTIGGVRRVYNRAQYSEQRWQMLQHWADYVESLATERKVIVGNFTKAR